MTHVAEALTASLAQLEAERDRLTQATEALRRATLVLQMAGAERENGKEEDEPSRTKAPDKAHARKMRLHRVLEQLRQPQTRDALQKLSELHGQGFAGFLTQILRWDYAKHSIRDDTFILAKRGKDWLDAHSVGSSR